MTTEWQEEMTGEEEKKILDDSFTSKEISAFSEFRRRVLISFILDEKFFLAHSAQPSTWLALKI